jgi:hypothetical protein
LWHLIRVANTQGGRPYYSLWICKQLTYDKNDEKNWETCIFEDILYKL